jgi:hypothetical protein
MRPFGFGLSLGMFRIYETCFKKLLGGGIIIERQRQAWYVAALAGGT